MSVVLAMSCNYCGAALRTVSCPRCLYTTYCSADCRQLDADTHACGQEQETAGGALIDALLQRDPAAVEAAAQDLIERTGPDDNRLFYDEIPAALDAAADLMASVSADTQAERLRQGRAIMTRFADELRAIEAEFKRPGQPIDPPVNRAAIDTVVAAARATVRLERLVNAPNYQTYAPLVQEEDEDEEDEEVHLYKLMVARHAVVRDLAIRITAASTVRASPANDTGGPTVEEIAHRLPIASGRGGKGQRKDDDDDDETFGDPNGYYESYTGSVAPSSSSSSPAGTSSSTSSSSSPVFPVPGDTLEETLAFFKALYDRSSMKNNIGLTHRVFTRGVTAAVLGAGFKTYFPITDEAFLKFRYWLFRRRVEASFEKSDAKAWFEKHPLSEHKVALVRVRNTYLDLVKRAGDEPGPKGKDPIFQYNLRKIADSALNQVLKIYPQFQAGLHELAYFDLATGAAKTMGAVLHFGLLQSILPNDLIESVFGVKVLPDGWSWTKALLGTDATLGAKERAAFQAQFGEPLIKSNADLQEIREFYTAVLQDPKATMGFRGYISGITAPQSVTDFSAAINGTNPIPGWYDSVKDYAEGAHNPGAALSRLVAQGQALAPSYVEFRDALIKSTSSNTSAFYAGLQSWFVSNRIEFYAAFGTAMNFGASYFFGGLFESLLGESGPPVKLTLQVAAALFFAFRRDQLAAKFNQIMGLISNSFEQLSNNQFGNMVGDPSVPGFVARDLHERLARRSPDSLVVAQTAMRAFLLRYPLLWASRKYTSPGRIRNTIAHLMEHTGFDPVEMAEDLRQYQGQEALGGVNPSILTFAPLNEHYISGSAVSTLALFCIAPEGAFFIKEGLDLFYKSVTGGMAAVASGVKNLLYYMAFAGAAQHAAPLVRMLSGGIGAVIGTTLAIGYGGDPAAWGSYGYTAAVTYVGDNPVRTMIDTGAFFFDAPMFSWLSFAYQIKDALLNPYLGAAAIAVTGAIGGLWKWRLDVSKQEAEAKRREAERALVDVTLRTAQGGQLRLTVDPTKDIQPAAATVGFFARLKRLFPSPPAWITVTVLFAIFATNLYLFMFELTTVRERGRAWPLQGSLSLNERATLQRRMLRRVPITTPVVHY